MWAAGVVGPLPVRARLTDTVGSGGFDVWVVVPVVWVVVALLVDWL